MSLTASSTVGQWLDHPVGGPILTAMIARGGGSADALAPARNLPLEQLVTLSQGKFPAEMVDALLTAYREAAPDDAAAGAGQSAAAPAAWAEEITPGRFAGQTVVVTGAASGIGRAVASRVAREGGRVVAVDLTKAGLDELVASLPGAEILAVAGDITSEDLVADVVRAAGGRVDALANVAGIMDDNAAIHEVTDAVWDRVMRVNVEGTMRLTRAVVPGMLEVGQGRVVNVASEASLRGSAAGVAYTASKHAVVGLTKSSAVMYAGTGVRVNAVAPGAVATGIVVPEDAEFGGGRLARYRGNIPSLATPAELAASITFLLSTDSVNLNGAILASDGGWSAV
ncbi:SDR family NAD(P)-dependent oxidoreductase [Myceligenerans pegani]|uniref:SDR family NAD(P)-dependent oxidoreductase n=1 Tax=Myceligenerans pegani TaxID=2776917 RepID=A0ABR9MWX1_9MICO|nr:SDR family NAD(P)-dependent oxidoreductase [Myceligenerans sp. TRM 65318]MBE1875546.1 SDR family NAD(P)-dependent oxidoreductase [Myceligenerans sp. TRM 65318]MBE3017817.1 SDR family NAD(P)-dependent oxidoreductase [Myceligenerans sp. TRM 65318]